MSHNTSPREKGQEETLTFQVLSHQAEEAPSAVGITSNPSVEGKWSSRDHPRFGCSHTRCSHPWWIWGKGAAELCAWGAATSAASPTEGITCKADLSHRVPLPHITSLQELLLYLQPLPPLLCSLPREEQQTPWEPGKSYAFTLFHTAHQGSSTQLWSSTVPHSSCRAEVFSN